MKKTIIGIIVIFELWSLLYLSGMASTLLLPSPIDTIETTAQILISGQLNIDISWTLYIWFAGYVLGILVGTPVGLFMGTSRRIYKYLEFPVEFFRSLPVTALFPLFLLTFGIGNTSKIAMVFFAAVFIIIINSAYGVLHKRKNRIMMAKIFRASKYQIFKDIIFFESLPQIFIGMRLALSASFIVVIISEMFIGAQYGLGQRIFDAYSTNLVIELYAILLILGIIGYFSNILFIHFEKKILFWVGK